MYNYWTILVGMVLCNFVANSLAVTVSLIVNTGGPENPGSGTFASINSAWDYIQDNLGSYVIQLSPQTHVIRANGKWNFSSSTVVMASASGRATLIAASMSVSLGSPAMVGTIGIEAGSLAMSTLDIIVPNMAEFSISNKNGSVTLSDVVASGSVPVKAEGQCTLAVLNVGSLAKMTVQGSTFQDMSMFMAAESGADMMIQTVNVTSCAQRGKQSTAGTSYTVIAGQGANKITIRDTKFSNCSHGGDNPDNGKIAGGFIGIFDSVQTDIEDIAFEACEAGGVGMIFLRNGIFNIDRGYFKGNMKGPTAVALYLLRIGTPQEGGLPTIAKFADLVFEENGKKINLPGSLLQIQTYNSDDTFEMSGITFLRNEAEACTDAWGTSGYLNPIVLSHVIMKDNICSNSGDTVDLTYEDWEVSGNWNNNQPFMLNDGGYWDGQLTLRRVHIRKQQMENFALECYGMGTIIIEDSLIEGALWISSDYAVFS
ncbi:hypothetical protein DFS34DRAFT_199428 [Phlyctochytrium arcticum]|nr:hypothetical protein DFS34DRAFT_199428 [Phlyctochytrium arcticum]